MLRVSKAVANAASRRICLRHEMRLLLADERDFTAGRLPAEEWEITAEAWRAVRRRLRGTA